MRPGDRKVAREVATPAARGKTEARVKGSLFDILEVECVHDEHESR